jgi:hypothetical protein
LCYTGGMNTFQKMLAAYKAGINNPYLVHKVSREVGLPYPVLCAFLEQESNGGDNVFGHDGGADGWASGWGKVTKEKYIKYRTGRRAGRGMQGVGPMQLTWWEFQDRADAKGGCWKPYVNMTVGAELLLEYWNQYGDWKKVGTRYNGSEAYGVQVAQRIEKYRRLFGG